jgi:hypothetical protein
MPTTKDLVDWVSSTGIASLRDPDMCNPSDHTYKFRWFNLIEIGAKKYSLGADLH